MLRADVAFLGPVARIERVGDNADKLLRYPRTWNGKPSCDLFPA